MKLDEGGRPGKGASVSLRPQRVKVGARRLEVGSFV
jgi:hypothetical protein